MKKLILIAILSTITFAEYLPAEVTTPSGTYSVEIDVNGDTVRCVQWDNGGCMTMFGAVLDSNDYASGENRRGDSIEIRVGR
jgi:hypothetical protein